MIHTDKQQAKRIEDQGKKVEAAVNAYKKNPTKANEARVEREINKTTTMLVAALKTAKKPVKATAKKPAAKKKVKANTRKPTRRPARKPTARKPAKRPVKRERTWK